MCSREVHPCDVSDEWMREYAKDGSAQGRDPLRQPRQRLRRRRPTRRRRRCSSSACRCWASATACRPWRTSWAARSKAATSASSALRRCARAATPSCSKDIADFTHRRRPRHAQRLDEPRRQGHRAAARLQADGLDRELPDRRHGRRGRAHFYARAVPPRSHAHAAGQGDPRALRARHLRRQARLGDARPHRRGGAKRSASRWATRR